MKYSFLFLLLVLFGCDIANQKLLVVNNSADDFYYGFEIGSPQIDDKIFIRKLVAHTSFRPGLVRGGDGALAYEIQRSSDSTLYIYLFNNEKITEQVIRNREYKVKKYKVKNLEENDWTIKYPDDFDN